MSLIKEPQGVDFVIESKPLSDVERKGISEYIKEQKLKKKAAARVQKIKKAPKERV